jgi:hypothetical protein
MARQRACAGVAFAAFLAVAAPSSAVAQNGNGTPVVEKTVVRVALSTDADERLGEVRVRRLLDIELDDPIEVAPNANGPLGADTIRVWIDIPAAGRAVIEVRRSGWSLARRTLDISRYRPEVAARFVAIATAEMIRVQARAVRRAPVPPKKEAVPGDEDGPFAVEGGGTVLVLPTSTPLWLAGPELALEHRRGITTQALYARWLVTDDGGRSARWLEVGAGFGVRWLVGSGWRLRFGGRAGGAALDLHEAVAIDGAPSSTSDWTVRAGVVAAVEAPLATGTWLTLGVEPGATMRILDALDAQGEHAELGGFALGMGMSIVAAPLATEEHD